MKIENTELEYDEADKIAMEYYMSESTESIDAWAKRVWECCALYASGARVDAEGKKLASVYANDPKILWENKKRRRRAAIARELLKIKSSQEDFESSEVPEKLNDAVMNQCKAHASYMRQDDRDVIEKAAFQKEHEEIQAKRLEQVSVLRAGGLSDEVIKALSPHLSSSLN